jgi:hypothetical protein
MAITTFKRTRTSKTGKKIVETVRRKGASTPQVKKPDYAQARYGDFSKTIAKLDDLTDQPDWGKKAWHKEIIKAHGKHEVYDDMPKRTQVKITHLVNKYTTPKKASGKGILEDKTSKVKPSDIKVNGKALPKKLQKVSWKDKSTVEGLKDTAAFVAKRDTIKKHITKMNTHKSKSVRMASAKALQGMGIIGKNNMFTSKAPKYARDHANKVNP